jgi:hypothetical protein
MAQATDSQECHGIHDIYSPFANKRKINDWTNVKSLQQW